MSSAALDMSLEDLIKSNKRSRSGASRGQIRSRASALKPAPARGFKTRGAARAAPFPAAKAPASTWQHDMFMDLGMASQPQDGRASAIQTGTKIYVSNLDYGVSNDDIKELFSEVGDLKRYSIHYDRSGRSKGTAEVVFSRKEDALAAFKRYNNVQLDGKPMILEIVGTNVATTRLPVANGSTSGNSNGVRRGSGLGRKGLQGQTRRGRRFGRGRGQGRKTEEKISAEDLDADLEKYHSEAMQIN